MWQGMDQRQFPRTKCQCVVKLTQEGARSSSLSTLTENIGLGGICVLLQQGLDIFSPVELKLDLKDNGPPLRLKGTIVWVVRRRNLRKGVVYDTGVEFSEMTPQDKARLEAIIDKAAAQK